MPAVLLCLIGGGMALSWWLQPWALYYLLRLVTSGTVNERRIGKNQNNRNVRLATAVYLSVLMTVTGTLGYRLHVALEDQNVQVKPMLFIVVWYTPAMQILRYFHLLSVGPVVFGRHFGLLLSDKDHSPSWWRIQLFMWSAPTIQFLPRKQNDNDDDEVDLPASSSSSSSSSSVAVSWSHLKSEVSTAFWDVLGMEVICGIVLILGLGEGEGQRGLPLPLQALIRVYIMGFSTAVLKILLECPSYYYILSCTAAAAADDDDESWNKKNDDDRRMMIRLFPIYNRPHLTQSPRELWHRWSVTAGYHLRLAYYEPVLQYFHRQSKTTATTTQRLVATAVPFCANCLLHITWWSVVVKGEFDFIYWNILFIYPLVSFAIQDIMIQLFQRKGEGTRDESSASSSSSVSNRPRPRNRPVPSSWWHRILNLGLLWTGFVLIGEPMSTAHGLNSRLTDVARSNLLLPPR